MINLPFKLLIILSFVFSFSNINATTVLKEKVAFSQINYLSSDFYGFEDGGSAFWIQHTEWGITSEKASDETSYSIKYNSVTTVSAQKKAHGGFNNSSISLPIGTYNLKLKVWVDNASEVSAFNFTFKDPWKNIKIDIDALEKETWVEITKEFTITEEMVASGCLLTMPTTYGGKGVFYVDEIQIWGEATIIPFASSIDTKEAHHISLPAGIYDVEMNVFVETGTSISKLYTQLQSPWFSLVWDIGALEKDQWLTMTKEINLEKDINQSLLKLLVRNDLNYGGGKGVFFIDDLKFMRKAELAAAVIKDFKYKIYPNPASEFIKVSIEIDANYKIYSIRGLVVKEGIVSDSKLIEVQDLESGTYLLQIITEKGSIVDKIIIL